jgi:hypothetical protein
MKVHALGTLLKRKICLISLFPEDKDETFEPPMPTSSRPYYLLGCNKVSQYNFYVSIFKDESYNPATIVTNFSSLQINQNQIKKLFDSIKKNLYAVGSTSGFQGSFYLGEPDLKVLL